MMEKVKRMIEVASIIIRKADELKNIDKTNNPLIHRKLND